MIRNHFIDWSRWEWMLRANFETLWCVNTLKGVTKCTFLRHTLLCTIILLRDVSLSRRLPPFWVTNARMFWWLRGSQVVLLHCTFMTVNCTKKPLQHWPDITTKYHSAKTKVLTCLLEDLRFIQKSNSSYIFFFKSPIWNFCCNVFATVHYVQVFQSRSALL